MAKLDGKTVCVRIAPSPTGPFHIGTARTALFNWLFARQNGGKFILRIEDTDKERSDEKWEKEITEGLKWLGLEPDGEIYRQSERGKIYKKYLEKLLKGDRAYYCYCTKEDLEAERQAMIAQGLPAKYGGHCRNLTEPPVENVPQVIRFKTPEAEVELKDIIRGTVKFDAALFGDMVIAKNLETPLFNFAGVVDDYEMKITHVIRGEDHLSNTPKQILLQKALDFSQPEYAHLPLILNPDRSKLSKRFAETSLADYKNQGYFPEAILNFLILLGWHPKGDKEFLVRDDLLKEFDLRRAQKAGAVFNIEKLDWLQKEHLRAIPDEEIASRLSVELKKKNIKTDEEFLKKVIAIEKERMKNLNEFMDIAGFFFLLPDYDAKLLIWQGEPKEKIEEALKSSREILENVEKSAFNRQDLSSALKGLAEEKGRGVVFWPLRVAISGQYASPDPLEIIEVLGKEESLRRIKIAEKKIKSSD